MRPLLRPRRRGLQPLIFRRTRGAVAIVGLAAALAVVSLLPPLGRPVPLWIWRFFIVWCVATPYWHFAEYRMLRDTADRSDLATLQTLSRAVWLGFAMVFAVSILAGARVTPAG